MRRVIWLAALAAAASLAAAHPLSPVRFELHAHPDGMVDALWSESLPRMRGASPEPRLPGDCRTTMPPSTQVGIDRLTVRWQADCGARGLVGRTIEVAGLTEPRLVILRVTLPDGQIAEGVLSADAPRFVVPAAPEPAVEFRRYVRLGIVHIAIGPDHLLFVFGLVLLAATLRRTLATVTAFTVGHSVTLALAVLGVVTPPAAPVEFAIAVSVLVVAIEVARMPPEGTQPGGRPWLVAGGFGLLHGLGFASVLRDAGLPPGAVPLALLAFNVGIELGQIAFVVCVLALRALVRPAARVLPTWTARLPAYAMGTLAAYWCFVRAAAWLAT